MKVLLLDIDSKLPNLALGKINLWHQAHGDLVTYDERELLYADKVYGSAILTRSKQRPLGYQGKKKFISDYSERPDIIWGGTGYDCSVKLPKEIDDVKLRINYGYTSRGCFRSCPFCLVKASEGNWHSVGDIYDVWDGHSDWVVFFDNNPYADKAHYEMICRQLIKENLKVDWNQGMDIRILNIRVIKLFNELRLSNGIRFAFDHPSLEPIIREKVALLRQYYKRKYIFFYVLVGFDTTFEEDLYRLNILKELDCRAYVMRHENTPKEKRYIRLAEWVNQFWTFKKYDFDTFCIKYEEYKATH